MKNMFARIIRRDLGVCKKNYYQRTGTKEKNDADFLIFYNIIIRVFPIEFYEVLCEKST